MSQVRREPDQPSEEALLQEVVVAPQRAFLALPDTQVIERPGWLQLLTPSLRQGGLNEVAFSALDEDEADAVIDRTIAEYRRHGLRFRWVVGPGSRPADLAERLARRGLRPIELLGMARATAGAEEDGGDGALRVEEVDEASVDDLTRVMAAGWGMDPAPLFAYHRSLLGDPRTRLFLGRCGGEPAGAASLMAFERSVYLIGAVVLPAFRRRGLYQALVAARLRHAAARGIPLATSQARADSSAPLLQRLGFVTVCRLVLYDNSGEAG